MLNNSLPIKNDDEVIEISHKKSSKYISKYITNLSIMFRSILSY